MKNMFAVVMLAVGMIAVVAGCGDSSSTTSQSSSDVQGAYNKMHEAGRKAGYSDQQVDDLAKKVIDANR